MLDKRKMGKQYWYHSVRLLESNADIRIVAAADDIHRPVAYLVLVGDIAVVAVGTEVTADYYESNIPNLHCYNC